MLIYENFFNKFINQMQWNYLIYIHIVTFHCILNNLLLAYHRVYRTQLRNTTVFTFSYIISYARHIVIRENYIF